MIGLEQPFEFDQRFVVEDDEVEVAAADPCLTQAVVDRVLRETVVVFLTRKPLFLSGRDDPAIANQGCRAVMIIG